MLCVLVLGIGHCTVGTRFVPVMCKGLSVWAQEQLYATGFWVPFDTQYRIQELFWAQDWCFPYAVALQHTKKKKIFFQN